MHLSVAKLLSSIQYPGIYRSSSVVFGFMHLAVYCISSLSINAASLPVGELDSRNMLFGKQGSGRSSIG
jgi:hypothetical protein